MQYFALPSHGGPGVIIIERPFEGHFTSVRKSMLCRIDATLDGGLPAAISKQHQEATREK